MDADSNHQAIVAYFIEDTERLSRLDDLALKYLEADVHRRLFPEPIEYQLDKLWKQASITLAKCHEDCKKLVGTCDLAKEIILVFETRIVGKPITFATIRELLTICSSSKSLSDSSFQIALDSTKALYQRLVISTFLEVDSTFHLGKPDRSIVLSSADKAIESALLTGLRPKNQSEKWLSTFSIDSLMQAIRVNSGISQSEFAKELERIVGWASVLRDQLLKAIFSKGKSELDIIADTERLAEKQNFDAELIRKYADFLCSTLVSNPKKLFPGLSESIAHSIEVMRELSQLEHELIREHQIGVLWSGVRETNVSSKKFYWTVMNNISISEFKQISNVFDDRATQEFLAEYYSIPLSLEFSSDSARFWCMTASFNRAGLSGLLFGNYLLGLDGDMELSLRCFESASTEDLSLRAKYMSACILSRGDRILADRMKGRLIMDDLSESGYAPAEFAVGLEYKHRWIQSNRDEDLKLALSWITKAANQNFGAAKVELELFGIEDWKPCIITSEIELLDIERSAISGDERSMFRYLSYATPVLRDMLKKSPAQIMSALKNILVHPVPEMLIFDFLRGSIKFSAAAETDQGFQLLRKAAFAGHPEACMRLSRICEGAQELENAIYWQRKFIEHSGFRGDAVNPLKRLYHLVAKAYPAPESSV